MNHNLWLLKHWPKEDQPNLDPIIYCLEEEFNEEQAIKVLKANEKPDYLAVLVEIVGFDTFQECLEAVNGPEPLPAELQTEDNTDKLMYKGKAYYFPRMILFPVPTTNKFNFLFKLKKLGEPK